MRNQVRGEALELRFIILANEMRRQIDNVCI
jgi:hypothetical protein